MTKKDLNELEKVVVKSVDQLNNALKPFLSDSTIRNLLIEGMDLVKRQGKFAEAGEAVSDIDFGGFLPAKPIGGHKYTWVDTLIERRLDGKRDGLKIVWNLPEGQFEFDPWSKKLDKVNKVE